ncbi:MAG: alpha/beta fold hydrolase [Rubrivivax sp.]|nr:alpha/beta fold hydrolase [Rubrivivax sp.]
MSTLLTLPRRAPARPTLLMLHASGGSPRAFAPFVDALAPQFRVLTPALLGYDGEPRWPLGSPTSLDAEAEHLAPLLHAQPVHLFGHSYGGAVALQMALRWPERVASLTLYEPVRFALLERTPRTAQSHEDIVGVGRRIDMEVLSGTLHAAAERFVDYWSGDGAWRELGDGAREAIAARMPKVRAEFEALFADRVPAAAYRTLAMPVHLIGGTRSPLPARQVGTLLAELLPNAGGLTLTGLGHLAPLTHAQRVLAALPGWLRPQPLPLAA